MVLVEELHGDAATDDLLASAGNLQSFFDHLGLEVAAAGDGEGAEEELEWLSNKDSFPTVDIMEPEAALMGSRKKVVRGRRRRLRRGGDEDLDCLPNKDAFLEGRMAKTKPAIAKVVRRRRWAEEGLDRLRNKDASPAVGMVDVDPKPTVTKVVRRRWRRRADEDLDWIPNKYAFLDVETAQPETAVTKIVLRQRRAGASIVPTASEPGRRQRRADEEVEWMPNKHAFLEVQTAETQPAVKKVVRRRLRRRPKEELYWLPKKDAFQEAETVVTKMVLRPRRAGPSIAPTAAKPRQRRCSRCGRRKTPHWRAGPEGPRTLCNACGKRYRSERLVPEYGPLSSATIRPGPELRSSMPRRIVEMCRSSATLVDVVVRSASPTYHLSRSPPRTKEDVCKKPLCGDIVQSSFDQEGLEVASSVGGEDEELEWPSNGDALPVLETMEPEPRVKEVARQRQQAAELGQRRRRHCGTTETPQWRDGDTLCNACGIRYRSGRLLPDPEYRLLGSQTFYPAELHSNIAQDALCRGSSSATSPLMPSHK